MPVCMKCGQADTFVPEYLCLSCKRREASPPIAVGYPSIPIGIALELSEGWRKRLLELTNETVRKELKTCIDDLEYEIYEAKRRKRLMDKTAKGILGEEEFERRKVDG